MLHAYIAVLWVMLLPGTLAVELGGWGWGGPLSSQCVVAKARYTPIEQSKV